MTDGLVEANPVFGSGIYAGDPDRVLDVLRAACVEPDSVDETTAGFVFAVEIE